MSYDHREDDEWRTIRVTMSEADKDFEYYLDLVEHDKKRVIITREGKDFALLLPYEINKTSEDKPPLQFGVKYNGRCSALGLPPHP